MRHIVSLVLQNEAGALARVANLFSSRGYNIESLNVAPMLDESVSRLTLVTHGSDEIIAQITKQLGKLIDVVSITDMTSTEHVERELALIKLELPSGGEERFRRLLADAGGRVLDDHARQYTVELIGGGADIDRFITRSTELSEVRSVVRSGAMAVARGAPVLGRN